MRVPGLRLVLAVISESFLVHPVFTGIDSETENKTTGRSVSAGEKQAVGVKGVGDICD